MITAAPADMFDALDPIDLDDLKAAAALDTRTDRKYIVPAGVAATLFEDVPDAVGLVIDGRRTFDYETTYFDTPELALFYATARGIPKRHKVRTRTYRDSASCALEVKLEDGRGGTIKHRMPWACDERRTLTRRGRGFVDAVTGVAGEGEQLGPALTTTYRRRTIFVPRDGARVTVDEDFRCVTPAGDRASLPEHLIVETKTNGSPGTVDHLLWRLGHRPVRFSKYGTGLAVAAGLPANRWHRTITRYLAG